MNTQEFRDALHTLGWSQRDAAHKLEVAPRLVRYWAAGDYRYPIPAVVVIALRALVKGLKST